MNMPKLTKNDKHHAEKVLRQKLDAKADAATTDDEIRNAQDMCAKQVQIENGIRKTILGMTPGEFASIVVSVVVPIGVAHGEQVKVLTGKVWNFIPKVRLR